MAKYPNINICEASVRLSAYFEAINNRYNIPRLVSRSQQQIIQNTNCFSKKRKKNRFQFDEISLKIKNM